MTLDTFAEAEALADEIGPRPAGSDAERRAARHLAGRLEGLGREVVVEPFAVWPAWQVGYAIVYLVMAYFVSRWNRGVLPVAAGLAVLFAVVAAVAGPAWFERDKAGFNDPALDPSILGLLTLILVPVQLLLVAFAMRGFQQQWNVEVEVAQPQPA